MRTKCVSLQSPIQGLNHRTASFWRDQKVTDEARSRESQCPVYCPPHSRSTIPNQPTPQVLKVWITQHHCITYSHRSLNESFPFQKPEDQPTSHKATFSLKPCSQVTLSFTSTQPGTADQTPQWWAWFRNAGHPGCRVVLGLLYLAFRDKNIYTRTFPCESICNTEKEHCCFVLLHILVTCSLGHRKDFRQTLPK